MRTKGLTKIAGLLLFAVILSGCQKSQHQIFTAVTLKTHDAVTPVQQTAEWAKSWWMERHKAVNERVQQGNSDLIFIGDSITHGWENVGSKTWQEYYADRNAVNMGFSGDRTQHVLWRLDNGNIEGINPKAAVIMIGTNNSNGDDNTAEEIADGIIAICGRLREKLPETKILLLAIFPRGQIPSAQREKNAQASKLASRIADGKMIYYLDIGEQFLESDKSLTKEIMPDYLHLSPRGYGIWAESINDKLFKLMNES